MLSELAQNETQSALSKIWTRIVDSFSFDDNLIVISPPKFSDFNLSIQCYTQECYVQSWTSPGSSTPQDTNCTATCPLSRKLFKLDEPDMQDTAGEAEMNS